MRSELFRERDLEVWRLDWPLETAKKLAVIVVDRRILEEGEWAEAEAKDLRGLHLKQQ